MNNRVVRWCYNCGHKSAFEKLGTCEQELSPYDDDFPDFTEILVDGFDNRSTRVLSADEIRKDVSFYRAVKSWNFMQCLICQQPTLIEIVVLTNEIPGENTDIEYTGVWEEEWEYDPGQETVIGIEPIEYILYPIIQIGPTPNPRAGMPAEVAKVFKEAQIVFSHSPRSSAALLRLALQMLFRHIKLPGKNIDDDIRTLVQKKILSTRSQKACDSIRIIGNNAVHPGEIDINEKPNTALNLFNLLNYIVEDLIIARQIDKTYSSLPEAAKKAAEEKDKKLSQGRNDIP